MNDRRRDRCARADQIEKVTGALRRIKAVVRRVGWALVCAAVFAPWTEARAGEITDLVWFDENAVIEFYEPATADDVGNDDYVGLEDSPNVLNMQLEFFEVASEGLFTSVRMPRFVSVGTQETVVTEYVIMLDLSNVTGTSWVGFELRAMPSFDEESVKDVEFELSASFEGLGDTSPPQGHEDAFDSVILGPNWIRFVGGPGLDDAGNLGELHLAMDLSATSRNLANADFTSSETWWEGEFELRLTPLVVPEPGTASLVGIGGALGGILRRRANRSSPRGRIDT